jgi:hypothetical protein
MSGTVPNITPNSITGMSANEQRPVYFLHMGGSAQPTLTVKGEPKKDDGEISIKWSSKLMKNVNDQQVNTKIMTAAEVTIFKAAARALLTGDPKKLIALQKFLVTEKENLTWVKMPYLAGLSDADFWKTRGTGKDFEYYVLPNEVKTILKRFTESTVWNQLGKIIAVDLFNGNGDRFTHEGHWQNIGNVMFQNQAAGGVKVVGLDTFDPNSQSSNLTTITAQSQTELNILKNVPAMRTFAEKVTESIEGEIKRGLKKGGAGSFTVMSNGAPVKIDENSNGFLGGYTDDLVAGIMQGVNELKVSLQRKRQQYKPLPPTPQYQKPLPQPPGYQPQKPLPQPGVGHHKPLPPIPQQKTIPQGILDRMTYLGW